MKNLTKGLRYAGQIEIKNNYIGVYTNRAKEKFVHLVVGQDMMLLWDSMFKKYVLTDVSLFENKRWYSYGDHNQKKHLANINPLEILEEIKSKLKLTQSELKRLKEIL